MHDPEFEKVVQQKMEELEFSPSELVWANLQRGLHKERARRRPLLWLFFLLGGIMLGAGGASLFYFKSPKPRLSVGGSPAVAKTVTVTGSPARIKTKAIMERSPTANGVSYNRSVTRAAGSGAAGSPTRTPHPVPAAGRASRVQVGEFLSLLHPDPDWDILSRQRNVRLSSATATVNARDLNRSAIRSTMIPVPGMANKRGSKKAGFSNTPSWEAGFAGGGGLSSAVISPPAAIAAPYGRLTGLTLASRLQLSAFPGGRLQLRFSKIRPDLSFWAGIFVQRPIMKKLSLTFGLNLHYYSTRLETGQKAADSLSTARASLFNSNPYSPPPVAQGGLYYATENYKYSNQYYFLEIPISMQWQFNRSRKMPLSWEGGLSLSRLISANALYYNESSGVYYKDGGAANPNHLMVFSSLMIGLSWRGNYLKLGPEGQYGLGSLVNANNAGSQHLFYGGIKIMVIPRKW